MKTRAKLNCFMCVAGFLVTQMGVTALCQETERRDLPVLQNSIAIDKLELIQLNQDGSQFVRSESRVRAETTGQALPGVQVFIDDRWDDQQKDVFIHETRTDANGIAHFWVPQGHFKLHAHGDNWDDGTKFKGMEVVVSGPRPAPVTIVAKPTVPLVRGTVVDSRGQPVENAHIKVGLGQAVLTDENGWFEGMQNPLYPSHMVTAQDTNTVQVDFGQGPDAAYVYAHTGDHVKIRLGEHFTDYAPPDSWVGKPLPDLSSLEIGFDPRRIKNKKTLVCFVDYTQHASQSAIKYLNRHHRDLEQRNLAIMCVQVTPVDQDKFNAWKKANEIRMPIGALPGDVWWNDKTKLINLTSSEDRLGILSQKWGVRSLPWMILTDENQTIMATGFEPHRVLQLVPDPNPPILPRNYRRGRR